MSKCHFNYTLLGTALITSLVLTACSSGSARLPVLNDDALVGSATNGFVNVAKTQGVRLDKVKKLVIPAFNVTYNLEVAGKAVTVTAEGDKETRTSTNIKVNVENSDLKLMQAITNRAYDVFVDELQKANFEVVAADAVANSNAYYQINYQQPVTAVSAADQSVTLVAQGLKLYDPDDKMDSEGGFLMGVANINSAVNGDLVAEFGGVDKGVAALNVNMVVQFGNLDLQDHRVSEAIAFNPSFTVVGEGTSMEIIAGFKAVSMPGRVFYIPKESAAYSLKQNMGSRTNVIAGMLDVSTGEEVEEYAATINPEWFEKAGIEQIERVSQLLIKAMTAP